MGGALQLSKKGCMVEEMFGLLIIEIRGNENAVRENRNSWI